MEMEVAWWVWMVLGLLLLVAEMMVPTDFFVFFCGVGAIATALVTGIGLTPGLLSQSIVFAVVSLVSLVTLRGWMRGLMQRGMPTKSVDPLIGEIGTTIAEIPANGAGRVTLRGSPWNARNPGPSAIPAGTRVRVDKVDSITLIVSELRPVDMVEDMM
jgi:membrane protein implicated in regulation of membrane protease activity